MEINPIEIEYNLKKVNSQRGKQIIIQEDKHIFNYSHKRLDNSQIYKCSVNKDKKNCYAYVVLDANNNFNNDDYYLDHTDHEEKQKEIQTLLENNTIKEIISKSNNKNSLKPAPIITEINNKLGAINPKYNNVRQNIYSQIKKAIPKDEQFLNKKGENILIYKDMNILVFTFFTSDEFCKSRLILINIKRKYIISFLIIFNL